MAWKHDIASTIWAWHEHDDSNMQHDDTIMHQLTLRGLPRNHHMHHLPSSNITRSSQDQIKLGINNTIVTNTWPQGAWPLPMILAQRHEYMTTRYPRYHRDPYGDHNPTNTWPVILMAITTWPLNGPWSLWWSQPDHYMAVDPYDDHNPSTTWTMILTAITTHLSHRY